MLWWYYRKYNIKIERKREIPQKPQILNGFKVIIKGRFSRRQRATKATYMLGKMPLNTLNVKIDYALDTIPIKNSLMSIKLYMYKTDNLKIILPYLIKYQVTA